MVLTRFQSVTTGEYDITPIQLYINEPPVKGALGQVTFVQECVGLVSHDASLSPSLNRAVFGNMVVTDYKLVAPWSSAVGGPPRTNWTRAGIQF